jgi:hypothetical protein
MLPNAASTLQATMPIRTIDRQIDGRLTRFELETAARIRKLLRTEFAPDEAVAR